MNCPGSATTTNALSWAKLCAHGGAGTAPPDNQPRKRHNMTQNTKSKPVAVVVGATSKWQSDGRNTKLLHGRTVDDSDLPVGIRWGVGGSIAQKFAQEGFFTVLTTRARANAAP